MHAISDGKFCKATFATQALEGKQTTVEETIEQLAFQAGATEQTNIVDLADQIWSIASSELVSRAAMADMVFDVVKPVVRRAGLVVQG